MIKLFCLPVLVVLLAIFESAVLKHVGYRTEAQDPRTCFQGSHKDEKRFILHQGFFVNFALAADIIVSPQAILKTALMRLMFGFMKICSFY